MRSDPHAMTTGWCADDVVNPDSLRPARSFLHGGRCPPDGARRLQQRYTQMAGGGPTSPPAVDAGPRLARLAETPGAIGKLVQLARPVGAPASLARRHRPGAVVVLAAPLAGAVAVEEARLADAIGPRRPKAGLVAVTVFGTAALQRDAGALADRLVRLTADTGTTDAATDFGTTGRTAALVVVVAGSAAGTGQLLTDATRAVVMRAALLTNTVAIHLPGRAATNRDALTADTGLPTATAAVWADSAAAVRRTAYAAAQLGVQVVTHAPLWQL